MLVGGDPYRKHDSDGKVIQVNLISAVVCKWAAKEM